MDTEFSPLGPAADIVYRCKICGIESAEASCFAGIATQGTHRLSGTCITCNDEPAQGNETWRRVVSMSVFIVFPTTYLVATRGTHQIGFIGLLILAPVFHFVIIVLHEVGHALTAKAVGLEVNLVALGVGRFLWSGNLLSTPIRLYAWPLLGLTYLGSQPKQLLRTRVWLSVLMGPMTNLALVAVAIVFWRPLTRAMDSNIILIWIMYNAITALVNLQPWRVRQSSKHYATDGMQLLQIPFRKAAAFTESLALGPAGATQVMYKDGDYFGAKDTCLRGLQRLPGNPWLIVLLSACHTSLGDYESGRASVEPLLDSTASLRPELHAAAQNNLAVALWLRDFNTPCHEESLSRADSLTGAAYGSYPCVLAHRTTRALLLAATNRSQDALALLEYINYERGSPSDRASREFARAFAFRPLGRNTEAEQALAAGLELSKRRLPWLTTIGLIPATATQ
jgi:hypothetical protein